MRRGFHAVLTNILVAFLLAPIGLCSAANCRTNQHGCCTGVPQMAADCCINRVSPQRVIPPQNQTAAKAQVSEAHAIGFAPSLAKARWKASAALTRPPVPQAPPIILRT